MESKRIGRKRRKQIAEYYVKENSTIRKTAEHFCLNKSHIHRELTLYRTDPKTKDTELAEQVTALIVKNTRECTKRGGATTKAKYSKKKKE